MWKPDITDWEKINKDAYAFILDQAKIRFDDLMLESEAISERLMKLAGFLVATLTLSIGIADKICLPQWVTVSFLIVHLLDWALIYRAFYGRTMIMRGSPPNELFSRNLDRPEFTPEEQLLVVYYDEIRRYQDRIETNKAVIAVKQRLYRKILLVTFVLIVGIATVAIVFSVHHPL